MGRGPGGDPMPTSDFLLNFLHPVCETQTWTRNQSPPPPWSNAGHNSASLLGKDPALRSGAVLQGRSSVPMESIVSPQERQRTSGAPVPWAGRMQGLRETSGASTETQVRLSSATESLWTSVTRPSHHIQGATLRTCSRALSCSKRSEGGPICQAQ